MNTVSVLKEGRMAVATSAPKSSHRSIWWSASKRGLGPCPAKIQVSEAQRRTTRIRISRASDGGGVSAGSMEEVARYSLGQGDRYQERELGQQVGQRERRLFVEGDLVAQEVTRQKLEECVGQEHADEGHADHGEEVPLPAPCLRGLCLLLLHGLGRASADRSRVCCLALCIGC